MHKVIKAIVYANNKEEAIERAKDIFEQLSGDNCPYDYFTTFDAEGTEVSGRCRWGDIPACLEASSRKGRTMIKDSMKWTKETFMEAIKEAREALRQDDEAIWRDKHNSLSEFSFYKLGSSNTSNTWLYDDDGEGITAETHLKNALEKWKCLYENVNKPNPHANLKVFVVPADVHY